MNHDYESQAWADNHMALSDNIAQLFTAARALAAQLQTATNALWMKRWRNMAH